jgi:hypothetical protein
MKQRILTAAATLAVLLSLAVVAGAQTRKKIEATIRFDFVAGESRLRAGDYSVIRVSDKAFLLRSADGKSKAIVLAPITIRQREEGSPERLVFNRYGSEYFLAQVWSDRTGDGHALYPAKTEARVAKKMEQTNSAPQTIEVFAKSK